MSVPPHNIEGEQALLGAILINNDALQWVIGFLQPEHFFEPIHARIYDVARTLIGATTVTLKTFLPADLDIAGLTLGRYLARFAAEATTIINAVDYQPISFDFSAHGTLVPAADSARPRAGLVIGRSEEG
jgi:replicative DNA helicase